MSDQDKINQGVAQAEAEGREIDDLTARIIASAWHGGQSSRLYALASSGAIVGSAIEVWREVSDVYSSVSPEDKKALDFLGTYLMHAGVRGPQEGWSNLHW